MKNLFLISFLFFVSCGLTKVDVRKAQETVENLLNDLKAENYQNLNLYFTDSSNETESLQWKTEKFKQLKDVAGAMKSFELTSSKQGESRDLEAPSVMFTYKVTFEKVILEENFTVIKDEGKYKITLQNIVNNGK